MSGEYLLIIIGECESKAVVKKNVKGSVSKSRNTDAGFIYSSLLAYDPLNPANERLSSRHF